VLQRLAPVESVPLNFTIEFLAIAWSAFWQAKRPLHCIR